VRSYGFESSIVWRQHDVSEDHVASIFWVEIKLSKKSVQARENLSETRVKNPVWHRPAQIWKGLRENQWKTDHCLS
jgi:hypothetical protein